MRRFLCILFAYFFWCANVWAQGESEFAVSGRVTSPDEPEGLPGVSVSIKGTVTGTITGLDGDFKLMVSTGDVLVFSSIGYNTQEIEVGTQTTIDVVLEADIQSLEEVVVVGYGSQKRKDISSSVGTVDMGEVKDMPAYSFDGAIQGRTAGVNITTSSATPGAAINVQVRGVSSIGASSQPLYIVDGIPLVSSNNSALNSNIQPVNPLADINPNDIESISVLKDAAAASIYGSRGANGVVIIKTKRGSAGKTKINLGYYTSVSEVNNTPDMMTSQQWINFLNVAAENDGLGENFWNSTLGDPNDPSLPTYDPYDEIFRTGTINNVDLSLQGGNDKTQFFISGNYQKNVGIQVGQSFERISGKLNLDHSLSDKIGIGTNLLVSRTNHERTINENDEYGVVINAQAWDPTAPLRDENGNYTNPFDFNGWWALDNPLLIAEAYNNDSRTTRVLASGFATYDIIEGLQFKTSWSLDFSTLNEDAFVPTISNRTPIGEAAYATFEEINWINENTLTYSTTFNDRHNVSILAGYTLQEGQADFSELNVQGFATNNFTNAGLGAESTTFDANGTSFGFESYIGRVQYGYDDRYLFSASFRADGSSRFSDNNQFGYFPSASAAWRISNESFFEPLTDVVNEVKLRASYGVVGNAEIGNFRSQSAWSLSSAYSGQAGISPSILADSDLSWERGVQANYGIDLGFLNGRFGLTADYYVKTSEDLLLDADVPGVSGFQSVTSNIGEIENKGFELGVNGVVFEKGDFRWNSSFNISFNENEVVDIINDGAIVSRNFQLKEGEPLSSIFLIKFLGVDPSTGDAVFEDLNDDGVINFDDRQIVGSGLPDYFGGFTNSFSYKSFTLDVFIHFVQGNEIFNQSRFAYENYGFLQSGIPYGNYHARSLNYWRQPGDVTDIPRPSHQEGQFQRFSTQYLEDGSFVRLKNVQLSYNFPKELVSRAGLSTARVYISGQNLHTWTDYLGFDPEINTNTASQEDLNTLQGEDFGTLGQARTFTFGVNLGF